MKRSLRQILDDSHIAAVTIAVLLLWSLDGAFQALWIPVSRAVGFLLTAVAILDIPYFSPTPGRPLHVGHCIRRLVPRGCQLFGSLASVAAGLRYRADPLPQQPNREETCLSG